MFFAKTPDDYQLNAVPDVPDLRDLIYQPALICLEDSISPPQDLEILDQGKEGACTGFGLAATINYLNQTKRKPVRVSARMLYEMAKKFDEWEGDDYSGSSCRGAMKGWQNMGVCSEELWPYRAEDRSELNLQRSKNARENTPGAYYRLNHRVEDFHTALNEVGILYVSALVHEGWYHANIKDGVIPYRGKATGGHAFAIVGYNEKGFFVQNSWGRSWGNNGVALWSYEDWRENISDGWVVRLAVPTPQLWASRSFRGEGARGEKGKTEFGLFKSPKRHEIKGHFVHIDDGRFHTKGRYFSSLADVQETGALLKTSRKYQHVLLYAHGGLNSPKMSAERIAALKNTFKRNGIYPYHFMYDTGLLEELQDIVLKRSKNASPRAEGFWSDLIERWDKSVENATRIPGRAFWREMKRGATSPFKDSGAGSDALSALLGELDEGVKVHVVGHSTGGILLAHLLRRLKQIMPTLRIESCSLMAPACTLNDFEEYYRPLLETRSEEFGINQMSVYNLSEKLEQDDTVTPAYRKSLLYLVSNAFEEKRGESILGMQKYAQSLCADGLEIIVSTGEKGSASRSCSKTHGGFDNDPLTMNDILKRILAVSEVPMFHFTERNLDY